MTTYKQAAAGYQVLVQQYQVNDVFYPGNFWFGGNILHTCLTYLIAGMRLYPDDEIDREE